MVLKETRDSKRDFHNVYLKMPSFGIMPVSEWPWRHILPHIIFYLKILGSTISEEVTRAHLGVSGSVILKLRQLTGYGFLLNELRAIFLLAVSMLGWRF